MRPGRATRCAPGQSETLIPYLKKEDKEKHLESRCKFTLASVTVLTEQLKGDRVYSGSLFKGGCYGRGVKVTCARNAKSCHLHHQKQRQVNTSLLLSSLSLSIYIYILQDLSLGMAPPIVGRLSHFT